MKLYELEGLAGRHYSSFSWRTRMALAHKGIAFESCPVRISDKAAIAFSGQGKVPIIQDGETVVSDSWKIAEYLEKQYPDAPSLFGGAIGMGTSRLINAWTDRQLLGTLAAAIAPEIVQIVDEGDSAHLAAGFEKGFGKPMAEFKAGQEASLKRFRQALDPLRATLRNQPFICGAAPAYADYIVFSLLQWARIVSFAPALEEGDAVGAWFERLLDAHGGLGRSEPARTGAGR
jgi:glutathione S-transferase